MLRHIIALLCTLLIIAQALPIDPFTQYLPYNNQAASNRKLLVLKRHDSDLRNCYFSPVQCLLPVSDSTIRMFRLRS